MAISLPPPPTNPVSNSFEWREWFYTLWTRTNGVSGVSFNGLDFSGSNISSIVTRDHNTLTNNQGGNGSTEMYHLNLAQYNSVTSLPSFGTMATQNANNVAITGGTLVLTNYTVATLPVGVVGQRAYVTDALAPAFGAAVVGGGAVGIPVYKDGVNWKVG